jgi:hypothetical protein
MSYLTMWLYSLSSYSKSALTLVRSSWRLNFHSLSVSVSELLEYKYKSGTWLERRTKKENEAGHNVEEQ